MKIKCTTIIALIGILLTSVSYAKVYDVTTDYDNNGSTGYATPNDVYDDKANIQTAIDYVTGQGGGVLYFPAGVYLISGTLELPSSGNQNITIKGDGAQSTVLKSTNSSNMIDFDFDDFGYRLLMEDLTLLAGASGNNGYAVKVDYPAPDPNDEVEAAELLSGPGCVFNRIHIDMTWEEVSGAVSVLGYFSKGIVINDGWDTLINDCYVVGGDWDSGTGIEFSGLSYNSLVSNTNISNWQYGIDIQPSTSKGQEGYRIDNCIIFPVNVGVNSMGYDEKSSLWLSVADSHIACHGSYQRGIQLRHWYDVLVRGCTIHVGADHVNEGYGIVGSIHRSIISDNTFYGTDEVNTGGIVLTDSSWSSEATDSDRNLIKGNVFYNLEDQWAVWLWEDTTDNTVTDNVIGPSNEYDILDEGTDNSVYDNTIW